MMRITGGTFRGRVLTMPRGAHVRPTREKVRQAMFDLLSDWVREAVVLDVFSGSGALGLEAISRGASRVTFLEQHRGCAATVSRNVKALDVQDRCRILVMDAFKGLQRLSQEPERFSLVFADPPYYEDSAKNFLLQLSDCAIVTASAFVIIEHYYREVLPPAAGGFSRRKQKSYGDTAVSLYEFG